MPKPEQLRSTIIVDPSRLRLILQRLQQNFYDEAPASARIAAAVLVDITNLDQSPTALPH